MNRNENQRPRVVADFAQARVVASAEVDAAPERVFRALTSNETTRWWVRPGVFDTREWSAAVEVGGRWSATGLGNGQPYTLRGEFLEILPPRRLVHTWESVGRPGAPSTVAYMLEPLNPGPRMTTRLTLHHSGLGTREACAAVAAGWETSLERLAQILAAEPA